MKLNISVTFGANCITRSICNQFSVSLLAADICFAPNMRKIFIFSFDDGTVYDERFIQILNKHGIPCTFNLNTKLADYVWECQGHEIRRFHLEEKPELYVGHEIASHTATHPMITELTEEELISEIHDDCENLRNIFGINEFGFGVPFDQCSEREIEIVRKSGLVKYMRIC